MPIYEFWCDNCDRVTEKMTTKIEDDLQTTQCEHCGATSKRKPSNFTGQVNGKYVASNGYAGYNR